MTCTSRSSYKLLQNSFSMHALVNSVCTLSAEGKNKIFAA